MRIQGLTTMLMSAYLTAMLASSTAAIRANVDFAAGIDPMAAQKAFQAAVNGLGAAGFSGQASIPAPVATPSGQTVAADIEPSTEELINRLIKRALASTRDAWLDKRVGKVFNLNDGSDIVPVKSVSVQKPDGKHAFMITPEGTSIFISVWREDSQDLYLTRRDGALIAAAYLDDSGIRLVENKKAADKHMAEVAFLTTMARHLPPTTEATLANN